MNKTITQQYLDLCRKVLRQGRLSPGRNGDTLKLWSPAPLVVEDISEEGFPLLQNRPVPFYKASIETSYFVSGFNPYESMPKILRDTWWKPWDDKAKALGKWQGFYGEMLRGSSPEFDPLQNVIDQMVQVARTGVENRKMVISLWNAEHEPVLEACHSTALIFNLENSPAGWRLDLHHTQRSLDLVCGTGPDLVYSGLLMELIAQEVSTLTLQPVTPRKLVYSPVNVHIYKVHEAGLNDHISSFQLFSKKETVPKVRLLGHRLIRQIENGYYPQTISEAKSLFELSDYAPESCDIKFELVG